MLTATKTIMVTTTYETAWAQSLRDIPIFGTTRADHLVTDIPCASPMTDEYIQVDYEHMTGYQIINCLKERNLDYNQIGMILVNSHDPFTCVVEVAKMVYLTLQINLDAQTLKDSLKTKHFNHKYGGSAYYGQE